MWIEARRAAARREAGEEHALGPRPAWAIRGALALVALTGRLHGWPVPETEVDRREADLAHESWVRLRARLRPDVFQR